MQVRAQDTTTNMRTALCRSSLPCTGTRAAGASMPTIDMSILVIAADGSEPDLATIRQNLDYLGTPYTVYIATQNLGGLTPDVLSSGDHAFFHGIILTTANLVYLRRSDSIS